MISGQIDYLDPEQIQTFDETRQRRELVGIEELAASIREVGLINFPVVERDTLRLVAGRRRLEACRRIGMSPIPIQYADTLDPVTFHLIELEENIRRVDLTWQEETASIKAYHELLGKLEPTEHSQEHTARKLHVSPAKVGQYLTTAAYLEDADVASADKFSTAYGIAVRRNERKTTVDKQGLNRSLDAIIPKERPAILNDPTKQPGKQPASPVAEPEAPTALIQNQNFLEWVPEYAGDRFNFLHCDLPYGVNTGDKKGQSRAKETGTYDDSEDTYKTLVAGILEHQDRFVADSAHCLFWFSMNFYQWTVDQFTAGGWKVQPFPLIWVKSDNKGIMPDKDRQPRRIYETALLMSRGDRKLVRAVSNAFVSPSSNELHTSEKPKPVLAHFLRMLVDDSTLMLDPTCGSGNSVVESWRLGAEYSLGLELDPGFALGAKMNLQRAKETG